MTMWDFLTKLVDLIRDLIVDRAKIDTLTSQVASLGVQLESTKGTILTEMATQKEKFEAALAKITAGVENVAGDVAGAKAAIEALKQEVADAIAGAGMNKADEDALLAQFDEIGTKLEQTGTVLDGVLNPSNPNPPTEPEEPETPEEPPTEPETPEEPTDNPPVV